jgi:Fibronectin type III domain
MRHSATIQRRPSEWLLRGVLALLATIGVALSVALLPAAALAASSPSVIQTSYSNVTSDSVKLEAQINPGGSPTTYQLEYNYADGVECEDLQGCGTRVAEGGPLTGNTPQGLPPVEVTGLTPGTNYVFWMIAKRGNEKAVRGGEESFKTLAANTEPPSIDSESVSNVTERDATLEAQIETHGSYTGYWFQIDTNSSYNFTQPNCPFEIGGAGGCESISVGEPLPAGLVEPQPEYIPAGSGDRSLSLDLASIGATLQPDTTYHYRVIASNGGPTVDGASQTFTTPSQPTSPPEHGTEPLSSSIPAGLVASELPGAFPAIAATNASGLPSVDKPKATVSTDAQKLAKALKLCEKKPKKQRASCKKQAEKKYATTKKKKP